MKGMRSFTLVGVALVALGLPAAKARSLGTGHRLLLCVLAVLLAFVPATAEAARPPREQAELRALAAAGLKLEKAVERRKGALKKLSSELAAEYSGCSEIVATLGANAHSGPLLASAARLDFHQEAHSLLSGEFERYAKSLKRVARNRLHRRAAAHQGQRLRVAKAIPDFSLCEFIADWEAAEPYRYSPEGFATVTRELNPEIYDYQRDHRKAFAAGDWALSRVGYRLLAIGVKPHAVSIFTDPYRPAARYVKAGAKLRAIQ
jgi:hypothetical protein